MKDFVGQTINIGDKVAYFHSNQSGGIDRETYVVQGFTAKMVTVHQQQDFGRNKKYLDPTNCVVYKESKNSRETFDSIKASAGVMKGYAKKKKAITLLGEMLVNKLIEKEVVQVKEDHNVYTLQTEVFFPKGETNE